MEKIYQICPYRVEICKEIITEICLDNYKQCCEYGRLTFLEKQKEGKLELMATELSQTIGELNLILKTKLKGGIKNE